MDEKTAAALRAPFAPELIGKRPQPTCRDCSQSRSKVCDQHRKSRCNDCGQYITNAHIHLDFVGHADTTDRFIKVDPDWSWEPLAYDERGLPAFDQNGGMWIKLTIAGTTRIGYGDAQGKTGPNAVKEAIGDALRNAGMRFGVGLDMWRKEAAETADTITASPQPPVQQRTNHQWLEGVERRIGEADTEQELRTLANEIDAKVLAGACEQVHLEHLQALGRQRYQALTAESGDTPAAADSAPAPAPSPVNGSADPVAQFEARLAAVDDLPAAEQLKAEVMAAFKAQQLDPTNGNKLLRAIKAKQSDLEERAA
jgi:hypothetical protein